MTDVFEQEYKKLNPAQREAVEAIDGPVMVVAGPGTGKTQILALRIGNILTKTDIKADGILCLTFTNSAVEAMQTRLLRYIGEAANKVNVFTFHSFGMKVIEEHYKVLGLATMPKLLEDTDVALLFDDILEENHWDYLRPRGDSSRYFSDLKSLISLLKRERVSAKYFLSEVEKEIKQLEEDPDSVSTRGESKGQLKKEIVTKLENLERTKEVTKFIALYEAVKKEKNVLDYDDVLENLVKITELSPDAAADLRERYLYVLVDEHQDSSRAQNDFLRVVWEEVEDANIFVVGDDRQLIYGFSGASIDHFAGFKKTFTEAKLITLVDNYRSTQIILDASHALLESVMSDKKLISKSKENHPVRLIETDYPDQEIVASALDIKEKIRSGVNENDCAILVPTNKQVRNALEILHGMNIKVSTIDALNFFDQNDAHAFLRVLKIISNPDDNSAFALSFFDTLSGIPPLEAHTYLSLHNMREPARPNGRSGGFSFSTLLRGTSGTLFTDDGAVEKWLAKLSKWSKEVKGTSVSLIIELISNDLLQDGLNRRSLVSRKEILDTVLALAKKEEEKNPDITVSDFVSFLERLISFNEHVPLLMNQTEGVKVLTLHSSKGLEFDYAWIAHMSERSLNSSKRMNFTLPSTIADKIEERDIDKVKRKLYVAITRAKRFCTLSYARYSDKDTDQVLARVIEDLPKEVFSRRKVEDPRPSMVGRKNYSPELTKLVEKKYTDRYVSVSLLNNFYECAWKWYFLNLLQLPTPPAETLEYGIAAHSSINRILNLSHVPSNGEIETIVNEEVNEGRLKDERARERVKRGIQDIINLWVKNRLSQIKPGRKTEESISVKDENFPHLKIYGKIDLIENLPARPEGRSGGDKKEVRVTDFKTGSVRKKSDIEKLDEEGRMSGNLRQLAMYSYLLRRNAKWEVDVRESRLEFLEAKNIKETFYDRVISPAEINLLVKDIEDYDEYIKNGKWIERPCNYNSYGKNTECEYCRLAEIYTGPLSSQPK